MTHLGDFWGPEADLDAALLGAHPSPPWGPLPLPAPCQPRTDLHMLDFREPEPLGEDGGVW